MPSYTGQGGHGLSATPTQPRAHAMGRASSMRPRGMRPLSRRC